MYKKNCNSALKLPNSQICVHTVVISEKVGVINGYRKQWYYQTVANINQNNNIYVKIVSFRN